MIVPTPRAPVPRNPALDRLAQLYPKHFGAEQPLPLKRGIYEDLVAANCPTGSPP